MEGLGDHVRCHQGSVRALSRLLGRARPRSNRRATHPDSVFHLHSGSAPAHGRAQIRTAAAETFALVPDLTFTQVDLRVGDDFWVVRWKLSGTSVTGGAVDVDIADMVTVEGGAVKEKHTYVDGVAMAAALTAPPENA
ncbi:nuclear transport factor 2 family protein [Nocardia fluminea]|uniref:nuclear transport factor 2 family protein n=1 Tax=Nocardia fluminea TaxID=134984 RepID=UPI00371B5DED